MQPTIRLRPATFVGHALGARMRQRHGNAASHSRCRDRLLSRLLRHSVRHVPFQQHRLRGLDLRGADLEQIPPTSKTEMMAHFDETIAGRALKLKDVLQLDNDPHGMELPMLRGRYMASKTSGSSGAPSWIVQDSNDWVKVWGAVFARITRSWLTLPRMAVSRFLPLKTATLAAEHSLSMTWQTVRSAQVALGKFGDFRFHSVLEPVESIAASLNVFQPEYIHAYPTAMEMVARYKLWGGDCHFEPRLISVGSEKLTAMAKSAIQRAFPNSLLIDHYGLTECLQLSTGCPLGTIHLNSDLSILEPVDADGRRVPDGEFSDHVLVTNLLNRLQPLIRYRVNDSVRIMTEPCPCGSPFPAIELHSRKGDSIYVLNDEGEWRILSPPIVVDIMLHVRGVAQYQVIHHMQNSVLIKCLPDPGVDVRDLEQSVIQEFVSTLQQMNCSKAVHVGVELVEVFERTAIGGKLQQMISQVTPPEQVLAQSA